MKVKTGTPTEDGVYVTYIEHYTPNFPYPRKELLIFIKGVWGYPSSDQNYRGEVYGWIGPLPAPSVEELKPKSMYAIAIRGGGEGYRFVDGPTTDLEELLDTDGQKGAYILELSGDYEVPHTKRFRWNYTKDEWKKL